MALVPRGRRRRMAPSEAATLYRRDLYQSAGYERQVDSRTCVPASMAMMLNFIAGRDLELNQVGSCAGPSRATPSMTRSSAGLTRSGGHGR